MMGTQPVTESDFNVLQFEKQLICLKDSQEAINNCCKWCLENRVHHKKIVNAWLNVLKRVKVEQRLILFYLANDVVQYSKRRNYEYVESWGTALQKATTMVRDEKVKHKVLRIFKIWEQRNVYNEEFISDLCGLLSVVPSGSKNDEPHEFQPTYVINKIKTCSKLERDTDIKLKLLKEHNPNIHFEENLLGALKDRANVDDVEKEVEVYVKHMEDYINALKLEIKNRIGLISVLKQADVQLDADRKDVKVVANAYRMFGTRVKTFQKKLEEHKQTLSSPVPSPDINAPSPTSDTDIDLPEEDISAITSGTQKTGSSASYNPKAELQYAAGFYNSTSAEKDSSSSFLTNGFSSFIGTDVQFNMENLGSSLFNNIQTNTESTQETQGFTSPLLQNPPLPVEAPSVTSSASTNYSYSTSHEPLLPPPMPPFSKSEMEYGNSSFDLTYTTPTNYDMSYSSSVYDTTASYNTANTSHSSTLFQEDSFEPPLGANPYPPNETNKYSSEEYNPEDTTETWDQQEPSWNDRTIDLDTPESPPMFEKEGYSDPVEYHDNVVQSGIEDVDHRVIPNIGGTDSMGSLGVKDVDHRNLITLTESPGHSNSDSANADNSWVQTDQDYRVAQTTKVAMTDRDYRIDFEQLKLPPPPPPPPKNMETPAPPPPLSPEPGINDFSNSAVSTKSPRKSDNVENIDMDMELSDEDLENRLQTKHDNLRVIIGGTNEKQQSSFSLEPPPPLPDLPDDVDANNFLDDLSNDLHEFSNLSDDLNGANANELNTWNQGPLLPPPVMNFDMMGTPLTSAPPPPLNITAPLNSAGQSLNFSSPPLSSVPPPINFSPPPPNCASLSLSSGPPMNSYSTLPPPLNPPPPMPPLGIMPPPPRADWLKEDGMMSSWGQEQDPSQYMTDDCYGDDDGYMMSVEQSMLMGQNWTGPPLLPPTGSGNFNFRGRGINRGNFPANKRGWGRGANNRGGNNFRGGVRGFRGNRGNNWSRGNFRGNFRGGY